MVEEGFEIHLPQFEGPFDLLLFFIERDELDIHEISIAKITDDFLSYIHQMNSLNMELASEFIFVAATLMRIKAKMLLPRYEVDADGNEIDLKEDLIRKLIEYKKFKLVCEELKPLEEDRLKQEKRGAIHLDMEAVAELAAPGEELESFDLYKLMMVYSRVMTRYKSKSQEVKHTVVQYPYTIEKQKKAISALLAINKRLDFSAIRTNSENRVHFVYNFLAVLEMLQQELVDIQIGLGYNNFWISPRAES
ncbi:condensin subunit ScpA [Mucilaginibacter gracilis]|uniref:Segregation and condensation protein A n=1 Tax=Mucilaginibacter gracilis TaxID=423350 RepID=A0A495JC26_9SPHI|nr:segregation/condensation protein A [Mucilaginibacter gracilis]RKR85609.1 condensin subunit ScpA [Mucilaginibacter gracilis]